jgi:hypothetical protein
MTCALLLALTLGVAPGGKLYVKGERADLLSHPRNGRVLAKLPGGTEVTWLGADSANPSWHQVEAGGKRGFLPMSALTPNKAITEEEAGKPEPSRAPVHPAPYADDPAYVSLQQLTAGTQAQRARVAAHVKAAGLKVSP